MLDSRGHRRIRFAAGSWSQNNDGLQRLLNKFGHCSTSVRGLHGYANLVRRALADLAQFANQVVLTRI